MMFRFKLNTFKKRKDHQNMDKQKFLSTTDFKEPSQTPKRFSFSYVSSPYQRMISATSPPDNLNMNQSQLINPILSPPDSAANVILQNASTFRIS